MIYSYKKVKWWWCWWWWWWQRQWYSDTEPTHWFF